MEMDADIKSDQLKYQAVGESLEGMSDEEGLLE